MQLGPLGAAAGAAVSRSCCSWRDGEEGDQNSDENAHGRTPAFQTARTVTCTRSPDECRRFNILRASCSTVEHSGYATRRYWIRHQPALLRPSTLRCVRLPTPANATIACRESHTFQVTYSAMEIVGHGTPRTARDGKRSAGFQRQPAALASAVSVNHKGDRAERPGLSANIQARRRPLVLIRRTPETVRAGPAVLNFSRF
jgi:hypothetical protein